MGYTPTQRRSVNVNINGGAFDELNLLGVAYVAEQSTKLRQPPSMIDPAAYRCAHTYPAPPFASRGHCNPDAESLSWFAKHPTVLPFALETTSAQTLEAMMNEGTLELGAARAAELTRVALTNADGPALQAIRNVNPNALWEAFTVTSSAPSSSTSSTAARSQVRSLASRCSWTTRSTPKD